MKWLIFALISVSAHADGWLCEEESSIKNGSIYSVCGIGEAMEEGYARTRALDSAFSEFSHLCEISNDCDGKQRNVNPKRTSCAQTKQGIWKCYRMLEITLK